MKYEDTDRPALFKVATLSDVREHCEGDTVELWIRDGRLVVRAYSDYRYAHTDVDLSDLLSWARGADVAGSTQVAAVPDSE